MNEVLMIPPNEMGHLMNKYKERITSDPLLNNASKLSATRHKLLQSKRIPPGIKKARIKDLGSKIHHTIKRIKQGPFSSSTIVPPDTTEEILNKEEQTKAFEQLLKTLLTNKPQPKAKPITQKNTAKRKSTEVERLTSDWLPYNTRTQRWRKRKKST